MRRSTTPSSFPRVGVLNVAVVVLSVYVLLALFVSTVFRLPPQTERILNLADNAICAFFLVEFCIRFYQAPRKGHFLRWGWVDLVASIPNVAVLRVGRTLRLVRVLRILRAFRSTRHLLHHLFRSRVQGTFTVVALVATLMVISASVAILQVETAPDSNIKTAEDALWWAYSTITTVGYGDKYPVTGAGRLIAAVLMTVGVGLFGTFTGLLASWFVEGRRPPASSPTEEVE
ncbi:ion transporter [Hymenobacter sp. RP-2-7]|uniref:Ion transporter n=1 Tax=Hymenobacter polaris TaxID=2682546 RepID=A0A7Y0AE36_9BACT|nr:ion transporter [Hymenobacter polaris]NML65616.1 ion transporter [Hymenobacter polaris]